MASIHIGLNDKQRKGCVEILNHLLADEHILFIKTHNYHWNIVGPRFNDLHKFFEAQYEEIEGIIDEVAERARALDGKAVATLSEYVKMTRLREQPGQYPNADGMLKNLLHDHEAIITQLREDLQAAQDDYKDAGTADFLTGLMEQHEKMAWMLRSFLQGSV